MLWGFGHNDTLDELQSYIYYPGPQSRSGEKERTSGYIGLESHFYAEASCQTHQIDNSKWDQWQLSNHVISAAFFHSGGEKWHLLIYLAGGNVRVCEN